MNSFDSAVKFVKDMAKEVGLDVEPMANIHVKQVITAVGSKADADKLISAIEKAGVKATYEKTMIGPEAPQSYNHTVRIDILDAPKKASVTERLDMIASELEQAGRPDMALALDRVSDKLEKKASNANHKDIEMVLDDDGNILNEGEAFESFYDHMNPEREGPSDGISWTDLGESSNNDLPSVTITVDCSAHGDDYKSVEDIKRLASDFRDELDERFKNYTVSPDYEYSKATEYVNTEISGVSFDARTKKGKFSMEWVQEGI